MTNQPKTMIYFMNDQESFQISYRLKMLVREAIIATLVYEGHNNDCELSVTFASASDGFSVEGRAVMDMGSTVMRSDRSVSTPAVPLGSPPAKTTLTTVSSL